MYHTDLTEYQCSLIQSKCSFIYSTRSIYVPGVHIKPFSYPFRFVICEIHCMLKIPFNNTDDNKTSYYHNPILLYNRCLVVSRQFENWKKKNFTTIHSCDK